MAQIRTSTPSTRGAAPRRAAVSPGSRPRVVRLLIAVVTLAALALPAAAPVSAGVTTARQVSTGPNHACAVKSDATVWCWGNNKDRQLGDGTKTNRRNPVRATVRMGHTRGARALDGVVEVAAGGSFTCARRTDATVWCWGKDNAGQLGDGPGTSSAFYAVKVALPNGVVIKQMSAGTGHTCVVSTSNGIWCWGANTYGQLGDGTWTTRFAPVGTSPGSHVAAGPWHTCAAGGPGALCWGRNWNGQLGTGDAMTVNRNSPQPVRYANGSYLRDVSKVAVGSSHSCALHTDRKVRCWGAGGLGRLGNGSRNTLFRVGDRVRGLNDAWAISSGDDHTCIFRHTERKVQCWGSNSDMQLGKRAGVLAEDRPVTVSGISDVVEVDVNGTYPNGGYSCARRLDQSVWCWGSGKHGKLGNGATADSKRPVRVNL